VRSNPAAAAPPNKPNPNPNPNAPLNNSPPPQTPQNSGAAAGPSKNGSTPESDGFFANLLGASAGEAAKSAAASPPPAAAKQLPVKLDAPIPQEIPEGKDILVTGGELLTALGGALQIPEETRKICALYNSGLLLVSESHRNSPLIRSVVSLARRQNYQVNEPPQYVTPSIIQRAYMDAEKLAAGQRVDSNAMRRRINHVLEEASRLNANDVHVETSDSQTKIQFRIDGSLREWETWTAKEGDQFVAAVYSHADVASGATANWNEPLAATLSHKSGPDSLTLPNTVGGIRCQWMPLTGGRYLNMRLNYDGGKTIGQSVEEADVDSLGFNAEQTKLARHLRDIPGAMRMIAGPVNQGKTTTLRIMLNRRMNETHYRLNCLMVEDPPEGGVKGARQIGVSSVTDEKLRARLLSEVMRASLRLDPDIVMLGEIRDFETATMAFRLALTGRQVYTTLHVYAALAIPQRVRDLGIEPYLVYDHHLLRGLFSQRLSRKSCPHCKIHWKDAKTAVPNLDEVMARTRAAIAIMKYYRIYGFEARDHRPMEEPDLSNIFFSNPAGCEKCSGGRSGRTVLVEIVDADGHVMDLLSKNEMDAARQYWLSPGGLNGISMQWHGIEKVQAGMLSPVDTEFELGPLASPKEITMVEGSLGAYRGT